MPHNRAIKDEHFVMIAFARLHLYPLWYGWTKRHWTRQDYALSNARRTSSH